MPVKILNIRERGRVPKPFDPLKGARFMKIRMIETRSGSQDGINVNTYEAGKSYDLTERLAGVFIDNGWAVEDKAMDNAPETKAEAPKESSRPRKKTPTRRRRTAKK